MEVGVSGDGIGAGTLRKKAEKRYMSGMLVLSVSTLICKVIGLMFKIPMLALIGIEGMAYFSAAYHIYTLLFTISTSGIPVAVSMMTAKSAARGDRGEVKRILTVALWLLLPIGAMGSAVLFFGAEAFSRAIDIPGAEYAVKALAPTMFFICASGALRGYFQGHEIMLPTAVSQLIESLSKLLLGLALAYAAINMRTDAPITAAAAISGLTVGVAVGACYLVVKKLRFSHSAEHEGLYVAASRPASHRRLLSEMVRLSLPITLSSSMTSLAGLADTALITSRLTAVGMAHDAALALYSGYSNLAVPVFNLPTSLISPVAMSLVPSISSAVEAGERKTANAVTASAFRVTMAASIPASLGMAVFAEPILLLIYPSQADAAQRSAPLLAVLAGAVLFSCLITVTNAVLQAWGHPYLPIVSITVGTAVKMISEFLLIGSTLGIYGAPLSTLMCSVTVVCLNVIFMRKCTPFRGSCLKEAVRTVAAALPTIAAAGAVYYLVLGLTDKNAPALLAAILAAVCLYCFAALKLRVLTAEDIESLPCGEKLVRLLGRAGLL